MFWGLLAVLIIGYVILFYYLIRELIHEEKVHTKKESEHKIRISQLENELTKKDKEREGLLTQLKNENLNKLNLETKLLELQAQLEILNKDLSSNIEMHKGLKGQYGELEQEMKKMQQELANKEAALKAERISRQQLQEKYEALLKTTNSNVKPKNCAQS